LFFWETLLGLAVIGLLLSVYATGAYYRKESLPSVPLALCRAGEDVCRTILQTPYARLFGVPNAVLGLGFYFLVAGVSVWGLSGVEVAESWVLLWRIAVIATALASMVSVVLAPYLSWVLVVRLRHWCPI